MDENKMPSMVWRAAVTFALDVLTAYRSDLLTGTVGTQTGTTPYDEPFHSFLNWRAELGRAFAAIGHIQAVGFRPSWSYRSRVTYSQNIAGGSLHTGRFVRERLLGFPRGVPLVRMNQDLQTPENFLVSEVLSHVINLARRGLHRPNSDGRDCKRLLDQAEELEREPALADLRHFSRPAIRDLCLSVYNKSVAGSVPDDHPAVFLSRIYADPPLRNPEISEDVKDSFLRILLDENGTDKIFELLCLGIAVKAAKYTGFDYVVDPRGLRAARGRPFLIVSSGLCRCSFYFQTAEPLGTARYEGGVLGGGRQRKPLGGCPDFVLKFETVTATRYAVIDPKYRTHQADNDIIYKMIGYGEAFGINPYLGIALAPEFDKGPMRTLYQKPTSDAKVGILRFSLNDGPEHLAKLLSRVLRRLFQNQTDHMFERQLPLILSRTE